MLTVAALLLFCSSSEMMNRVLTIIKDDLQISDSSSEVEIDINTLQPVTLRKLQKLVKTHHQQNKKRAREGGGEPAAKRAAESELQYTGPADAMPIDTNPEAALGTGDDPLGLGFGAGTEAPPAFTGGF